MIHNILRDYKLVLASESPRRKQIMEFVGLTPLVFPSKVDEPPMSGAPYKQAIFHAKNKLNAVRHLFDEKTLIIAADTVVYLDDRVLGKPSSNAEIREHLLHLSGRSHFVYTGVCLGLGERTISDYQRTVVLFKDLTEKEIEEYIQTGEPKDKAGSYGIQGYGSQFITSLKGCYFNVMGFPLNLFYQMLEQMING